MANTHHIFYDSTCGFCSGFARFVQKRDPKEGRFKLAALDSEEFLSLVSASQQTTLPDSAIVRLPSGNLLVEWAMSIFVFRRLGSGWPVLGLLMGLVPRFLGNSIYRFIAKNRKRFQKSNGSCRV